MTHAAVKMKGQPPMTHAAVKMHRVEGGMASSEGKAVCLSAQRELGRTVVGRRDARSDRLPADRWRTATFPPWLDRRQASPSQPHAAVKMRASPPLPHAAVEMKGQPSP